MYLNRDVDTVPASETGLGGRKNGRKKEKNRTWIDFINTEICSSDTFLPDDDTSVSLDAFILLQGQLGSVQLSDPVDSSESENRELQLYLE